MAEKPLDIQYDEATDIVVINGIRYSTYSAELFRTLARAPLGTLIRIEDRNEGTITVRQYAKGEMVIA